MLGGRALVHLPRYCDRKPESKLFFKKNPRQAIPLRIKGHVGVDANYIEYMQ